MKIAIGCDHAGFELKKDILDLLKSLSVQHIDCGTDSAESVDYPDFGEKVSRHVSSGDAERGILICGTGLGMSMVANKFPKIRAALCSDMLTAKMSRLHTDANVLVLGARIIGKEMAKEIVKVWLQTPFEGDRHKRRISKIEALEEQLKTDESPQSQ